ncbi:MAG: hypothetical protein AAGC92_15755 [Pseudomonadota bacterium]
MAPATADPTPDRGAAVAPQPPARTRRSPLLRLGLLALVLFVTGNLIARSFFSPFVGFEDWFPFLDRWKIFQYQTSYADLGFVRRGLIGTLLGIGPNRAPPMLLGFAAASSLAMAAVFVWLLAQVRQPELARALLISPALFLGIGFDLGRFDHLNYLLMLVAVLRPGWALVLLAPAMLLIHEAAIASHVPLLLALHLQKRGLDTALWAAGVAAAATLAALLFLGREYSLAELMLRYPLADTDALRVLNRGVGDNLAEVWDYASNRIEPVLLMALVFPAAYLALLGAIYLRLAGPGARLALLAALTPLALSPFGYDFTRWFGLAAINLTLLICRAARRQDARPTPRWALAGLVLFALPGPLGLVYPYPLAFELLGRLF